MQRPQIAVKSLVSLKNQIAGAEFPAVGNPPGPFKQRRGQTSAMIIQRALRSGQNVGKRQNPRKKSSAHVSTRAEL